LRPPKASDRPGYALGKAISRTGQVGGRPSKTLANALHGRPYGLSRVPAEQLRGTSGDGLPHRMATELLFEHHEMMRWLFERTLVMPGDDPQRRELMRTLASELDIHEVVEDAIFYPALRPMSEGVEVAYAEHGVLADLLAATVKFPTASPESSEHLWALQAAFLRHAGSEERPMFAEAQRLGDARRRELGHELEARLDDERTSRFRHAFREFKLSLLEKV